VVIDYNLNPFAHPGDKDEIKAGLKHRMKVVKSFIGRDLKGLKTLDIGDSNRFSRELGIQDNTTGDLNRGVIAPSKDYDVVTFFEVIEHLMAPLKVLEDIRDLLKPGGVCYVATPVPTPLYHLLMSEKHLTEYKRDRLEVMFRYAGFEVVKYRRFVLWDWWFMFTGFRPFLRTTLHRNQIWELRKPNG
jgi:SAM-dependent methyltransferase